MNPNKQRIAIAKACGWKFETGEKYIGGTSICVTSPTGKSANGYVGKAYRSNDSISGWDSNDGVYFEIEDIFKHPNHVVGPVPDYLNDLNAMHGAEKVLACTDEGPKTSERRRYLMILEAVIAGPPDRFGDRPNRQLSTPFATATQRAEAFLRTIGKWKE